MSAAEYNLKISEDEQLSHDFLKTIINEQEGAYIYFSQMLTIFHMLLLVLSFGAPITLLVLLLDGNSDETKIIIYFGIALYCSFSFTILLYGLYKSRISRENIPGTQARSLINLLYSRFAALEAPDEELGNDAEIINLVVTNQLQIKIFNYIKYLTKNGVKIKLLTELYIAKLKKDSKIKGCDKEIDKTQKKLKESHKIDIPSLRVKIEDEMVKIFKSEILEIKDTDGILEKDLRSIARIWLTHEEATKSGRKLNMNFLTPILIVFILHREWKDEPLYNKLQILFRVNLNDQHKLYEEVIKNNGISIRDILKIKKPYDMVVTSSFRSTFLVYNRILFTVLSLVVIGAAWKNFFGK